MVLEQGALSGKYNTEHPMPEGSQRGATYNPMLSRIEKLTDVMEKIGAKHQISVAQTAIAWAIAKGTHPIIGVTREEQVEDAAKAAQVELSEEEIRELEAAALQTGVDTRGSWENPMTES